MLKAVADRCYRPLRRHDLCARYGGEEFAILLPGTPAAGAATVAERLRHLVLEEPVHDFVEAYVPEPERQRTSEVMLRILSGTLQDLLTLAREREGLPARATDEPLQRFLGQSVFALTDAFAYPAPLVFTLEDFQQIQASVFQVTRAPGKNLVYLGCVLLIIGVVAMLYIRERRLWIWLGGSPDGQATSVSMALSATRQTLDTDKEFNTLRGSLLGSPAAPIPAAATDAGPH